MQIGLSAADEAFRAEVRGFLDQALTPQLREAGRLTTSVFTDRQWSAPWHRALYEKGWVAPAWPVEHGGNGWSELQRYIFASECAAAGAPSLAPMGLRMCGPVLATARRSRKPTTCRASFPARTIGARATPSRARAPTWPRCSFGR